MCTCVCVCKGVCSQYVRAPLCVCVYDCIRAIPILTCIRISVLRNRERSKRNRLKKTFLHTNSVTLFKQIFLNHILVINQVRFQLIKMVVYKSTNFFISLFYWALTYLPNSQYCSFSYVSLRNGKKRMNLSELVVVTSFTVAVPGLLQCSTTFSYTQNNLFSFVVLIELHKGDQFVDIFTWDKKCLDISLLSQQKLYRTISATKSVDIIFLSRSSFCVD